MLSAGCRGSLVAVQCSRGVAKPRLLTAAQENANRVLVGGPVQIQVATMKATFGEKYPYKEPFPYETNKLRLWHDWTDPSLSRMNENSKVIVVEGNVAVGKNDFAARLAKQFDLKYFPSSPDANFNYNGLDLLSLNDILPKTAKYYSLHDFCHDPNPEAGWVGRLLIPWYLEKYMRYVRAVEHMMNTGQGVVVTRSVFSDIAYLEALKKIGWIKPFFYKYFKTRLFGLTAHQLQMPHLTVFLDAPVSTCMERLKTRNDPAQKLDYVIAAASDENLVRFRENAYQPRDAGSPNINEKFLTALEDSFQENLLDGMKSVGEVVELDWKEVADDMDMEVIAEEISKLRLEAEDNEARQFRDWFPVEENKYQLLRYTHSRHDDHFERELYMPFPHDFESPEIHTTPDDAEVLRKVLANHPIHGAEPGYIPGVDNVLFKNGLKPMLAEGEPSPEEYKRVAGLL